ncbi:hypothetical protein [Novibacillus thermophilus]|uniref:hypothetical protein n=1 Tax=Novibacillus thermophilus TaxID=1471761 RepID=UPI001473029E|nr:hypothetical protein [Novibacillus thermophilus]
MNAFVDMRHTMSVAMFSRTGIGPTFQLKNRSVSGNSDDKSLDQYRGRADVIGR